MRTLVLALTAACGGSNNFECDPALVLSDGLSGIFAPLEDGGELVITHGTQGGNHVSYGAQVTGPGPTLLLLPEVTDTRTDTLVTLGESSNLVVGQMEDFDGCTGTFSGGRALLAGAMESVCALDGAPVRLVLQVAHFDGEYSPVMSARVAGSEPLEMEADATARIEAIAVLDDFTRDCICAPTSATGECPYTYY